MSYLLMWEFTDPLWFSIMRDICLLTWAGLLLATLFWENPCPCNHYILYFVVLIYFFSPKEVFILIVILD